MKTETIQLLLVLLFFLWPVVQGLLVRLWRGRAQKQIDEADASEELPWQEEEEPEPHPAYPPPSRPVETPRPLVLRVPVPAPVYPPVVLKPIETPRPFVVRAPTPPAPTAHTSPRWAEKRVRPRTSALFDMPRDPSGQKRAMVIMAVFGPPRALDPYPMR